MIMRAFRTVLWTLAGTLALAGAVAAAAAESPPAPAPPAAAAGPIIQQVEFRELPLAQALRLLADQTGMNLLCSAEAGKTRVTLFLKNVPARVAVEQLCKAHGLWYRTDEATGIVRIMTLAEFQGNLQTFREEQTAVFTLLYPNAVGVASAIHDLYGDRVHLSLGAEESDDTQTLQDRFDRFDIVDQRSLGLGLFSSGATVTDISGQQSGYGNGGSGYTARSYGTAATAGPPVDRDAARIDPRRRASDARPGRGHQPPPAGAAGRGRAAGGTGEPPAPPGRHLRDGRPPQQHGHRPHQRPGHHGRNPQTGPAGRRAHAAGPPGDQDPVDRPERRLQVVLRLPVQHPLGRVGRGLYQRRHPAAGLRHS